jgi:hypothetical protein
MKFYLTLDYSSGDLEMEDPEPVSVVRRSRQIPDLLLLRRRRYIAIDFWQKLDYTIMIKHRLSIYTLMEHSLLSPKLLALALNSLDTLSDIRIKSIYASRLIKMLSITNPSLACLVLLLLL